MFTFVIYNDSRIFSKCFIKITLYEKIDILKFYCILFMLLSHLLKLILIGCMIQGTLSH
jgi:hypothetical protein